MALQSVVEGLDSVPEALHSSYVEKNGAYHLNVDGMVDKSKLDEFRSNNVKMLKDIETINEKYKHVDLDQYAALMKAQNDGADDKLIKEGKIEELVEERTKRMRETHNSELGLVQTEADTHKKQLESLMIDASVRNSATKQGVAATAMEDVILRAKAVFQLKNGQATPFDNDGNVVYASGSSEPMSVDSWVTGLASSAPHLFTPSKGGGSNHDNKGGGGGKTASRAQFDAMSQGSRPEFAKGGGKVVD